MADQTNGTPVKAKAVREYIRAHRRAKKRCSRESAEGTGRQYDFDLCVASTLEDEEEADQQDVN